MNGRWTGRVLSWIDASLAAFGHGFIRFWTKVERSYRRPFSWIAFRLKFAFYPLLALGAIAWLAWDWGHARSLNSAEDAIFDRVVQWRPVESQPSGRVVVVEIDECSIDYFRVRNEGGWPWSRQRHADLLDQLDRAGVRAVGYDVLFTDPVARRSRRRSNPRSDGQGRRWTIRLQFHAAASGLRRGFAHAGVAGPGGVCAQCASNGTIRRWPCCCPMARR